MPEIAAVLAQQLSEHPDYRVLRRIALDHSLAPDPGRPLLRGVVLDTETTGLNFQQDRIIEVGLLRFDFDPQSGVPIRIVDTYSALEDPGVSLSPEVIRLTGIQDSMVAGKVIDDDRIAALAADASLVIAHNAAFDRPFVERRWPLFRTLPWGCSLQDIPWDEEGIHSKKLEYIAYRLGFFFDAHRTLQDCEALLKIISQPLSETGSTGLGHILQRQTEHFCTIFAVGAPFASKDRLKSRQYRWDAERRTWYRELSEHHLGEEVDWLRKEVYGGKPAQLELEERSSRERFSSRQGQVRSIAL